MKPWHELKEDTRQAIIQLDRDIGIIIGAWQIRDLWKDETIQSLTDEDKEAIKDFVLTLLKQGQNTLREGD